MGSRTLTRVCNVVLKSFRVSLVTVMAGSHEASESTASRDGVRYCGIVAEIRFKVRTESDACFLVNCLVCIRQFAFRDIRDEGIIQMDVNHRYQVDSDCFCPDKVRVVDLDMA